MFSSSLHPASPSRARQPMFIGPAQAPSRLFSENETARTPVGFIPFRTEGVVLSGVLPPLANPASAFFTPHAKPSVPASDLQETPTTPSACASSSQALPLNSFRARLIRLSFALSMALIGLLASYLIVETMGIYPAETAPQLLEALPSPSGILPANA